MIPVASSCVEVHHVPHLSAVTVDDPVVAVERLRVASEYRTA